MERKIQNKQMRSGMALIIAMIFIVIFASISVSLVSFSGTNLQIANNQHKVNEAYAAAQSGFECAKRLAVTAANLGSTYTNDISETVANTAWANFCSYVAAENLGGQTPTITSDEIVLPPLNFGPDNATFQIRFSRLDTLTIRAEVTGTSGDISRKISMDMEIGRKNNILEYAIASRGRIWVTGDSTIHGGIYSSWNLSSSQLTQLTQLEDQLQAKIASGTLNSTSFSTLVSTLGLTTSQKTTVLNQLLGGTLSPSSASQRCISLMSAVPSVAPLNMTSDSAVLGTISTCWTLEQIQSKTWQFETLDENGNPIDQEGNPLGTNYEDRFYGPYDEIQGYHEGINYGIPPEDLDGMNIADYDTTIYYNATRTSNGGSGDLPAPSATQYYGDDASLTSLPATCGTKYRYERFPHDAGDYTTGSGISVKRYIYKDQTFSNVSIPDNRNALFINCTFNNVLFVDCNPTSSSYTNNVRFDNCAFNGTIVSDTPQYFNWQKNCLYFTGEATFDNNSGYDEATILAPHFNVNLGNTNPEQSENNVLEGAIVGGIVDVRGNAQILGTIISMADTSSYTSGYVTNIGATLGDGGSETTLPGDIGTIDITPAPNKKIPSGMKSPLEIKPILDTYSEGF